MKPVIELKYNSIENLSRFTFFYSKTSIVNKDNKLISYNNDAFTSFSITKQPYAIFDFNIHTMPATIPVELDGNEYISEVVSSRNITTNHIEYFVKINGDPACFVNFINDDNAFLHEESSSPDLTAEFKEAVKNSIREYLTTAVID